MKKHVIIVAFLLPIFIISGCVTKQNKIQLDGSTMGTQYHISVVIPSNNTQTKTSVLQQEIESLLLQINQQMSTYKADSEITQFNHYQQTDWFVVSKDFVFVVNAAQKISALTQGAFDITIAPLIDLWGFGSKIINITPTKNKIKEEMQHTGYHLLEVRDNPPALRKLDKNLRIDLSAIAKGFAVDKISDYLKRKNFNDFLVEIGGEIRSNGLNLSGEKWHIAIESPVVNQAKVNQIILLSDKGLATSGDYRNYFVKKGIRYSHTLDPKTGSPIKHNLASVTVMHNSTMKADAFSTALMVMGEIEGKHFALQQKLEINMIIREGNGYKSWNNLSNKTSEKNND